MVTLTSALKLDIKILYLIHHTYMDEKLSEASKSMVLALSVLPFNFFFFLHICCYYQNHHIDPISFFKSSDEMLMSGFDSDSVLREIQHVAPHFLLQKFNFFFNFVLKVCIFNP